MMEWYGWSEKIKEFFLEILDNEMCMVIHYYMARRLFKLKLNLHRLPHLFTLASTIPLLYHP